MSPDRYDAIVAGAGMVGACAAVALAARGMRVALVEPADLDFGADHSSPEYDLRVSAISPVSRAILEELGIWERLVSGEELFEFIQSFRILRSDQQALRAEGDNHFR